MSGLAGLLHSSSRQPPVPHKLHTVAYRRPGGNGPLVASAGMFDFALCNPGDTRARPHGYAGAGAASISGL
ncbi:MAG: hypothetical protein JWP20_1512 [Roseomonas sp.]|nr:hypothetical protein [Roseomonas sp.]